MSRDELVYIKTGESGSIIATVGYILLVISCLVSERIESLKRFGIRENGIDPAKITAVSAWIRVAGIGILAFNNAGRLKDMAYRQNFSSSEEDIGPQLLVTVGSWVLLIGIILVTIGSQKKAQQPGQKYILG